MLYLYIPSGHLLPRKLISEDYVDFLMLSSLEGTTFDTRCNLFAMKVREDPSWAFSCILRFIQSQKNRVDRKEITGGTLRNCIKGIKTFCEVTGITIPWKKISRGLPKGNDTLMIGPRP